MPHIMYVINSFNGGGAESGLVRMVQEGMFSGCELSIVALVRGEAGLEAQLRRAGHEPRILLDRPRMRLRDLPILYRRLRSIVSAQRPDIVIASLPQANLLARLSVWSHRSTLFVSFEHNTHLAKRVYEMCYRWTSRRVDWVFADAGFTLETALQRLYTSVPSRRSIVPLVAFDADSGSTAKAADVGAIHLVNTARFTSVKNQKAIIEALAQLPENVRLTLYGEGPLRSECMQLADALGLADRVSFPGYVADWAQRPADIFVLASRHEGLCIVVLEAMNAGIPVIAPLIGGIRDYAGPTLIHVLDDCQPERLAPAITDVVRNLAAARIKARAAQHMVQSRFGASAVRDIYREINRSLRSGWAVPPNTSTALQAGAPQ